MATHMLVVSSEEEFQRAARELEVNGEGQEKAVCLFSDGSNLHHAMAYRKPLLIHMITPTIDCTKEVALTVQWHEQRGAKVIV
jgi:hypothetical protein